MIFGTDDLCQCFILFFYVHVLVQTRVSIRRTKRICAGAGGDDDCVMVRLLARRLDFFFHTRKQC